MALRRATAGLAVALLLAGCAVGPDFQRPAAPEQSGYTPQPVAPIAATGNLAGGGGQRFAVGRDIPGQWWELFRSPALDSLVRQALAANPDLEAAQAALRQAKELALAQGGVLYPAVDAGFSAARERPSAASTGFQGPAPIFSLANASVSVSYAVDLFGGNLRAIESAEAQAELQRYQLEAAYLSLSANLVTAAVQEASLRAQIATTNEILEAERRQLEVVRRQFELGGAAKSDVLAQEATLAQTRATLPALGKQLALLRNQLTALAGRFPAQQIEQSFDLSGLTLPDQLPLSLPSQLVEQRPDLRAAEALLHQASADLGVATANQFPQLTLSAGWGSAANGVGALFSSGTGLWNLGLGLTQPVFHGGELLHRRKAAEAALDKAAAQYRSAVLTAFRSVADALSALQSDTEALAAQLAAERSAADSLALSRQQYALGAVSYLTLLNAERTHEQTRIGLVQAQAARYADTAALFQALGGGWWNRSDVAAGATAE